LDIFSKRLQGIKKVKGKGNKQDSGFKSRGVFRKGIGGAPSGAKKPRTERVGEETKGSELMNVSKTPRQRLA